MSAMLSVCFVALVVLTDLSDEVDYCQWEDHTMCLHPDPGPGSDCGDTSKFTSIIPDESIKQFLLKKHNELRAKIAMGQEQRGDPGPQPPAGNMLKMTWHDEIAVVAQRMADQCVFDHDPERRISEFPCGQNLYWAGSSEHRPPNWDEAIQGFYDEVAYMPNYVVEAVDISAGSDQIGHYTQLVWANSFKLGCGAAQYYIDGSDTPYNTLITCNYGPGGNVLGTPMYKEGEACSSCPEGTSCDNGLCANAKMCSELQCPVKCCYSQCCSAEEYAKIEYSEQAGAAAYKKKKFIKKVLWIIFFIFLAIVVVLVILVFCYHITACPYHKPIKKKGKPIAAWLAKNCKCKGKKKSKKKKGKMKRKH